MPRPASPALELIPGARRRAELRVLRQRRLDLLRQRAAVHQELLDLDAALGLGGAGLRPPGATTMNDALHGILSAGGRMRALDAARALSAAGHPSAAKDTQYFYKMVARVLAEDPRFRRVARGVYEAR